MAPDRGDMCIGDGALKLRLRRLRLGWIGDDGAQAPRRFLRIGEGRGRSWLNPRLAIGSNQRDVDPVHRRAADDADGGLKRAAHGVSFRPPPGTHSTSDLPKSLAARAATNR